jgi:hypothetical protein
MPVAFSLIAGKVLSVLHILEAPRVIEDFILAALAVQVPAWWLK